MQPFLPYSFFLFFLNRPSRPALNPQAENRFSIFTLLPIHGRWTGLHPAARYPGVPSGLSEKDPDPKRWITPALAVLAGWLLTLTAYAQPNTFPSLFSDSAYTEQLTGHTFLKTGSFITCSAGGLIRKISPNGNLIRQIECSHSFTQMEYDSAFNRLYFYSTRNIPHNIVRWPIWPYLSPYLREGRQDTLRVSCLDSALNPVWSFFYPVPRDTLGSINAFAPDGNGGVYVSVRFSGDMRRALQSAKGDSSKKVRLTGGYYYVMRIDAAGRVKWGRKQLDYAPGTTAYRSIGFSFLVPRGKTGLDVLTCFADTNGFQFGTQVNSSVLANYKIQRCRFDSAGRIRFQRKGDLSGPGFFVRFLDQPARFIPMRLNQQPRLVLPAEKLYPEQVVLHSAFLVYDTNFTFIEQIQVPFRITEVVQTGPDRLACIGDDGWLSNRIQYALTDLSSRSLLTWLHTPTIPCWRRFKYPSLAVVPFSGPEPSVLLNLASGSWAEPGQPFLNKEAKAFLRNGRTPPCKGFFTPNFPPPANPFSQSLITWSNQEILHWQNSSPLIFQGMVGFRETEQRGTKLFDLCKPVYKTILPPDTVLCGDSVAIAGIPSGRFQKALLNGVPLYGNQFMVRKKGWYRLELFDTCHVSPTVVDSIWVGLDSARTPELAEDTLVLCPEGEQKIRLKKLENAEVRYRWSPAIGLSDMQVSEPVVRATPLRTGFTTFIVTSQTEAGCTGSDTLVVEKQTGPVFGVQSRGDSTYVIESPQPVRVTWSINGGRMESFPNPNQIKVKWGPWFEGQEIRALVFDSLGCQVNWSRIREKDPLPLLQIPNFITHNGDGKNDHLEIRGLLGSERIRLRVFNRWGKEVFLSEDYRGEFPDQSLNEGLYFVELDVQFRNNWGSPQKRYSTWVQVLTH